MKRTLGSHTMWSVRVIASALVVSLGGCAQVDDESDSVDARGVKLTNGLELQNGLLFSNGLALSNGVALSNGLAYSNGLALSNGLAYSNGLDPTKGYMATTAGRKLIKYLVECALPAGDSVTKNGVTFLGRVGLAPEWKFNQCDTNCQQWVSACLLARTNEFGVTVNIDMRAPHPSIGLAAGDASFTFQEGAFFGNLFSNPPTAYVCPGQYSVVGTLQKRTCTSGSCAMKKTDYVACTYGCDVNGTFNNEVALGCWNSTTSRSRQYFDAVITTYLKW